MYSKKLLMMETTKNTIWDSGQTWNLSKILHGRIFRLIILHRQFHLISTVIKTQKHEWKWRNLHRWPKFYTAAGSDGSDKSHICWQSVCNFNLFAHLRRFWMILIHKVATLVLVVCSFNAHRFSAQDRDIFASKYTNIAKGTTDLRVEFYLSK